MTDTLTSFHWLRASERGHVKLALLTFRAIHGLAPVCVALLIFLLADD
jgi:hypothetical protein